MTADAAQKNECSIEASAWYNHLNNLIMLILNEMKPYD